MGVILRYKEILKTYKTRGYRIKNLENYRYLFPIKSSPVLAGITADLIGDGHLQGEPKWRIDFTSKNISELKRFEKEIKSLFKINCKIRKCSSNKYGKTYNIAVNCSPIARILFLCGVPRGQKVLTSFGIPYWIKEDRECFRRFCNRLFSCEGYIMHEPCRKLPQVRLEMWKAEYLFSNGKTFIEDICNLLCKYFDIRTKITYPKSKCNRKDNIKKTMGHHTLKCVVCKAPCF